MKVFKKKGKLYWEVFRDLRLKIASKSGQGTTEYAILVGVLVVIAIIAIIAFRPSLQALWDSIQSSMQSLS